MPQKRTHILSYKPQGALRVRLPALAAKSPSPKGKRACAFGWRRAGDSNPRFPLGEYSLSRRAPSASRSALREQSRMIPYFPLPGQAGRTSFIARTHRRVRDRPAPDRPSVHAESAPDPMTRPRRNAHAPCKTKTGPAAPVLRSCGAACRIRTYDLLIRSQTLYPAELMPQRKEYNRTGSRVRQALFQKKILRGATGHWRHTMAPRLRSRAMSTTRPWRMIPPTLAIRPHAAGAGVPASRTCGRASIHPRATGATSRDVTRRGRGRRPRASEA